MLFKLWHWLCGYVEITITGQNLTEFINLANQQNILLENVQSISPTMIKATVFLAELKALRNLAETNQCLYQITAKKGLYFFAEKLNSRKSLLVGGMFFVIGFYIASSLVFCVEVTSPYELKNVDKQQILQLANRQGLKKYVFRQNVDFRAVEKSLIMQNSDLSWVGINNQGTKVVITVVEKLLPPTNDNIQITGDIVAACDGLIDNVYVKRGIALVAPGDTVVKGQVLISSFGDKQNLSAMGIVEAKVWYRGYGECELQKQITKKTGNSCQEIIINWHNQPQVVLGSKSKEQYSDFTVETKKHSLVVWRKTRLPVELLINKYIEQNTSLQQLNHATALDTAVENGLLDAKRQLPLNAQILQTEAFALDSEPNIQRVQIITEALIDIAQFKPNL